VKRIFATAPAARSICVVALLLGAGLWALRAQIPYPGVKYARGQDVSPTFDGWEANADGSFSLYFGYYNRNAEEEIDVPLGQGNNFDRDKGDDGQPTHFYSGRRWFVFKTTVAKDWPKDKRPRLDPDLGGPHEHGQGLAAT